ncbi:MAG TPA: SpoIIE family protein phosphatase [Caulobacteraceae bacterium]|nr:SpoIIE family protein phosphatase [Caulobacteraceae bacterium]
MDQEPTRIMTMARSLEIAPDDRVHLLQPLLGATPDERRVIDGAGLIIGRAAPADLVVPDSEVSRSHCRVELRNGEALVTDLGSTNGTYLNGERITVPTLLPVGGLLQIGRQVLKHEWRTQREIDEIDETGRDLARADAYVRALLPPPLTEGPIRTDWVLQPSAKLGGDAFGYTDLSENKFAIYLMDVSGHGSGAALHSVAVMNLLRQGALADTDPEKPGDVLATLNTMFQMERHAEMYFTLWYGVFDRATRRLDYAAAGHHASYLVPADRSEAIPLRTKNGVIGCSPGRTYSADSTVIPPGATLYVFSDGVFEVVTSAGLQWGLNDFVPLILEPMIEGVTESSRLHQTVMKNAKQGGLDDDFTLVVAKFD